jgi:hypothetical protein
MPASYHIGRSLLALAVDEYGIDLEGTCRLAPGRIITLIGSSPTPGHGRSAQVAWWRLVATGRTGLIYRGRCQWLAPEWELTTHAFDATCRNAGVPVRSKWQGS